MKTYKGEWNSQCPYCLSRRVKEDGYWADDDKSAPPEWVSYGTAHCEACGHRWHETEIQPDGCPNCGVHHSLNISNVITSEAGAAIIGIPKGECYLWCMACGCVQDYANNLLHRREEIDWDALEAVEGFTISVNEKGYVI